MRLMSGAKLDDVMLDLVEMGNIGSLACHSRCRLSGAASE
jgi:hypothetical protein